MSDPAGQFEFDREVRDLFARARSEAQALRHEYVGTEHILLALLSSTPSRALHVIRELGGSPTELTRMVLETVKRGRAEPSQRIPFTSRTNKATRLAVEASQHLTTVGVNSTHLLLGLLAERRGIAAQVLNDQGITLERALPLVARANGVTVPIEAWAPLLPSDSAVMYGGGALGVASLSVLQTLVGQREQAGSLEVVADLSLVDPEDLVELMASLDGLHRAFGGSGLRIEAQSIGVASSKEAIV